jgi:hypothetical protein
MDRSAVAITWRKNVCSVAHRSIGVYARQRTVVAEVIVDDRKGAGVQVGDAVAAARDPELLADALADCADQLVGFRMVRAQLAHLRQQALQALAVAQALLGGSGELGLSAHAARRPPQQRREHRDHRQRQHGRAKCGIEIPSLLPAHAHPTQQQGKGDTR